MCQNRIAGADSFYGVKMTYRYPYSGRLLFSNYTADEERSGENVRQSQGFCCIKGGARAAEKPWRRFQPVRPGKGAYARNSPMDDVKAPAAAKAPGRI